MSNISPLASETNNSCLQMICPRCKTEFVMIDRERDQPCPHCYHDKLSIQSYSTPDFQPNNILMHQWNKTKLTPQLIKWVKSIWIKPEDLEEKNLSSRLNSFFIPLWNVDAHVDGNWHIQAGFDYEVLSTKDKYIHGQWQSQKVNEVRVRWEERAGSIQKLLPDVHVSALKQYREIITRIGKFNTNSPDKLPTSNGILYQVPDITPTQAWESIQTTLIRLAEAQISKACQAQHIKDLKLQADWQDEQWSIILLPVLTTWYTDDDGKRQVIWINGQTGKIGGVRKASVKSAWKWTGISLGITAALIVLGVILFLASAIVPPLGVIAIILIAAGAIGVIAAFIPVIWAWWFNYKNSDGIH